MNIKQTAMKEKNKKKPFKCNNNEGRTTGCGVGCPALSGISSDTCEIWRIARSIGVAHLFMGEDAHLWTLWRFLLKQERMQETIAGAGGMWLVQTDDISHAADGENLFCLSVELAVYPDTSSARTLKVVKLRATLRIDVFSNDKGEMRMMNSLKCWISRWL